MLDDCGRRGPTGVLVEALDQRVLVITLRLEGTVGIEVGLRGDLSVLLVIKATRLDQKFLGPLARVGGLASHCVLLSARR